MADDERADAAPADDDARWRFSGTTIPDDPVARDRALLEQCEARVAQASVADRPQRLLQAIRDGGCTALAAGAVRDCVKCRICPSGHPLWEHVSGYYKGSKQKVGPTERSVVATCGDPVSRALPPRRVRARCGCAPTSSRRSSKWRTCSPPSSCMRTTTAASG